MKHHPQQLAHRANIYRILADCFKYPESPLKATLELLPNESCNYEPNLKQIGNALFQQFPDEIKAIQSLQVEYARLFIGPYHVLAPPYSSIYLDEPPQIMGNSTNQAIDFYLEANLNPSKENKEPPDHISTELEFMYYLLYQYVDSKKERYLEQANTFLNQHLGQWAMLFAQRVIEVTQTSFYQELIKFLEAFIRLEKQMTA